MFVSVILNQHLSDDENHYRVLGPVRLPGTPGHLSGGLAMGCQDVDGTLPTKVVILAGTTVSNPEPSGSKVRCFRYFRFHPQSRKPTKAKTNQNNIEIPYEVSKSIIKREFHKVKMKKKSLPAEAAK